jgi:hypothetical protein
MCAVAVALVVELEPECTVDVLTLQMMRVEVVVGIVGVGFVGTRL